MNNFNRKDIIFNVEYHKKYDDNFNPKDDFEAKQFKSSKWHRSSQAVSYITRDSACDNKTDDENKIMNHLINNTDLENNDIMKSSHIETDEERVNSFSSLGDLTKEKKLFLEKELATTGSTIWSSVISFTPEYSNCFCSNRIEAKKLIENVSKTFFKSAGLDPDNIEWYASFHNNTSTHNHIHFVFFEKEPKNLDSKGNPKYSNHYINKNAINKMIAEIYKYHHETNHDYFNLRDLIRNEIKSSIKEDYFQRLLYDLSKVNTSESYQYARMSNEDKLIINKAFKTILKNNPRMNNMYNEYITKLYKEQRELQNIWNLENPNKKNKFPKNITKMANNRIEELYNRCGNTILQILKTWKKNERKRKHYNLKNPFSNHNNCKSASNTRKYNSKLARQLKNSCLAMLEQNQQEQINNSFDKSVKEFYDKLMEEERESKEQMIKYAKESHNSGIDRD